MVVRSAVECPACGTAFTGRDLPQQVAGTLTVVRPSIPFAEQRAVYRLCVERAIALGYKIGWAIYEFERRLGFKPSVIDGEIVDSKRATMHEKRATLARLQATARERGYKMGWAAHQYRRIFGVWPRKGAA